MKLDMIEIELLDTCNNTLTGRQIDVVKFVDFIIDLVKKVNKIYCKYVKPNNILFIIGKDNYEIKFSVNSAKSKHRMICARLAKILVDRGTPPPNLYGGQSVFEIDNNRNCRVNFKNISGDHFFLIDMESKSDLANVIRK